MSSGTVAKALMEGSTSQTAVAEAITPLDGVPPFELFGGATDEAWRNLHLEARETCLFLNRYLPSLTGDPDFEESMVGVSGIPALRQGFQIYEIFKALYEKYAGPISPDNCVLDFGCGWGRVIRFFLREVAPDNLIGLDAYEPALAACRKTNRWSQFFRCDVLPPTELKSGSFDLIYAFSVFSHLSEEAHWRWLEEFKRILRPSGVLVLTTFQRDFLVTGRPSSGGPTEPPLGGKPGSVRSGRCSFAHFRVSRTLISATHTFQSDTPVSNGPSCSRSRSKSDVRPVCSERHRLHASSMTTSGFFGSQV